MAPLDRCSHALRSLAVRGTPRGLARLFGATGWRALVTNHFRVATDLASRQARALAATAEQLHAAIGGRLFAATRDQRRIDVLAIASARPRGITASYRGGQLRAPLIVLPGASQAFARSLAHEITHHFVVATLGQAPPWFAEGLAVFMESLGAEGGAPATFGGLPRCVERLRGGRALHVREVLLARDSLDLRGYAIGSLLVHFLFHTDRRRLDDFQRALERGEDHRVAFRRAFPEWDPAAPHAADRLEDALREHVDAVPMRPRRVTLPPALPIVSERWLSTVELDELCLWGNCRRDGSQPSDEERVGMAERLLATDATNVAAAWELASTGLDRISLARRAADAHPDDARAWLLLWALSTPEDPDRERALRRLVEVTGGGGLFASTLSRELALRARSLDESVAVARAAVAIHPWDAMALRALADALDGVGSSGLALAVRLRLDRHHRSAEDVSCSAYRSSPRGGASRRVRS